MGSCGGPNSIVVGRRIYGGSSIAAVSSARHICNQSVAAIVWCPRAERLRIKVPDPGVRLTARIPLPRERHGARRQAAADSGYIGRLFMSDVCVATFRCAQASRSLDSGSGRQRVYRSAIHVGCVATFRCAQASRSRDFGQTIETSTERRDRFQSVSPPKLPSFHWKMNRFPHF